MHNYQNHLLLTQTTHFHHFLCALKTTYLSSSTQKIKQAQAWLVDQITFTNQSLNLIKIILTQKYEQQLKIAAVNFLKTLCRDQRNYLLNKENFREYCKWILEILMNDNCSLVISKSLSLCIEELDQSLKIQITIPQIQAAIQEIQNSKWQLVANKMLPFIASMIVITDTKFYPQIFQKKIIRLMQFSQSILKAICKKIESVTTLQAIISNKQELNNLEYQISFIGGLIEIFQTFVEQQINKKQNSIPLVKKSIINKLKESKPLFQLFLNILRVNFFNTKQIILDYNKHRIGSIINTLKGDVCYLLIQIYTTFQKQILQLFLETYFCNMSQQHSPQVFNILLSVFVVLEKCVSDTKYYDFFLNMKNDIIEHIFNYFLTSDQQIQYMVDQPDYFLTMAEDLCQERQLDEIAIKGANFLVAFAEKIDGVLAYITNLCIIIVDESVNTSQKCVKYNSIINSLQKYKFWTQSSHKKIGMALQVICCLRILIQSRQESLKNNLLKILNNSILQYLPNAQSLTLCRILLFYSYFPCEVSTEWIMAFLNQTHEPIYQQHIFFYVQKLLNLIRNKELLIQLKDYTYLLLDRICCTNPLFEQFIQTNEFIQNDIKKHQLVIAKIVKYITNQCSISNKFQQHNIQRISILLCTYLYNLQAPLLHEKLLLPLINCIKNNKNEQPHLMQIIIAYSNRTKTMSNLQFELLRICSQKLVNLSYSLIYYFEFLNLYLRYGNNSNLLDLILDIIINCVIRCKSESQKGVLTLLLEIGVLHCCRSHRFQELIQKIIQNVKMIWQKKLSKFLRNRVAEIVLSIFYAILKNKSIIYHGEFFSNVLKSHWLNKEFQNYTQDFRKFHCIYLLEVLQYFARNQNQVYGLSQALLEIILQNFEVIQLQQANFQLSAIIQKFSTQRLDIQFIKPLQVSEIDINPAKALKFYSDRIYHPLKEIDYYEILKAKIDVIMQLQPQIFESIQKSAMSQFYQKKIVNKQVRQIFKIKR